MQPTLQPRVFTLQEADTLVARIAPAVARLRELNERVAGLTIDIKELTNIWGNDLYDKRHPDHKYYIERISQREALTMEFRALVDQLQSQGIIIKDVDMGLIDLYFRYNSKLVFLCWKLGEDKIKCWHSLSTGYGARRALKELLVDERKEQDITLAQIAKETAKAA